MLADMVDKVLRRRPATACADVKPGKQIRLEMSTPSLRGSVYDERSIDADARLFDGDEAPS
jgi:hypothetical protein